MGDGELTNQHPVQKILWPRAKLPITNPPPPLKVWVSGFLSIDGNGKLMLAIMKIQKMALAPQKHILEQNSQLPTPLKFGSPVFKCQQKWKIEVGHYEKLEKWL